jgi:hypothetical protein
LSDILVDLTCSYESIHVPDGDPMSSYYVHSGMWHSATGLQRGLVHETIGEALRNFPLYGLVLCGHRCVGCLSAFERDERELTSVFLSLGGGVSA